MFNFNVNVIFFLLRKKSKSLEKILVDFFFLFSLIQLLLFIKMSCMENETSRSRESIFTSRFLDEREHLVNRILWNRGRFRQKGKVNNWDLTILTLITSFPTPTTLTQLQRLIQDAHLRYSSHYILFLFFFFLLS